jgi:hypothetical protein
MTREELIDLAQLGTPFNVSGDGQRVYTRNYVRVNGVTALETNAQMLAAALDVVAALATEKAALESAAKEVIEARDKRTAMSMLEAVAKLAAVLEGGK